MSQKVQQVKKRMPGSNSSKGLPKEGQEKNTLMQKEELSFWECQKRSGDESDLKMARDLPDDTPEFILRLQKDFEIKAAAFCFSGSNGRVLDAGCGNGNLLIRALGEDRSNNCQRDFVGMDFSPNMLDRARCRASGHPRAAFLQGSVTCLPFHDLSFDWIASSGVLTCLPSIESMTEALEEFNRILRPGGFLVVDFFNRSSHYTLVRRHIFSEKIDPPEYISFLDFKNHLDRAGFQVESYLGFDYKLCQGYLFMSRWRPFVDPAYVQERLSGFLERSVVPAWPRMNLLGYRIYVKCRKR